jgi:hypothetical protein
MKESMGIRERQTRKKKTPAMLLPDLYGTVPT